MSIAKPLLKEIFVLAIVVALMHYAALELYLYWTTSWFDVVMHFLGGLLIGLLAVFFFYTSGYVTFPREHRGAAFAIVIASVLVVGLGWELWELFLGWTDVLADRGDTILDIIMDTLGGCVACMYGLRHIVWIDKTN